MEPASALCKHFIIDTGLGSGDDALDQQLLASWPLPSGASSARDMDIVRLARASTALCTTFAPHVKQSQGLLTCRSLLHSYLADVMPAFEGKLRGSWCTAADMYAPLSPHRGTPMMRIDADLFRGILSLSASIVASEAIPGRATRGCVVLYKQSVLHSTLSATDTAAVYLLASLALIPAIRAENKTTKPLQKLYSNLTDWGKATGSPLHPASWQIATSKEQEGLLTYGSDSAAKLGECPLVHLNLAQPCRLVAWQTGGFAVLAMVEGDEAIPTAELPCARHLFLTCLRDLDRSYFPNLPQHKRSGQEFVARVTEAARAHDKGHIAGHRYALVDTAGCAEAPVATATPRGKLTGATSENAQAVVAQLWSDVQVHARAEARSLRHDAAAAKATRAYADADAEAKHADADVSNGSSEDADAPAQQEPQSNDTAGLQSSVIDQREADAAADANQEASAPAVAAEAAVTDADPDSPDDQDHAAHDAEGNEALEDEIEQESVCAGMQKQLTGPMRMEAAAQTPSKKWVCAKWALGGELLHIDDTVARDTSGLAAAMRNATSLVDGHFPGMLGA